ncbi:hypothetical protein PSN45_004070 [Yamadazyma tenuis]|uniref:ClpP/crotonase n=1 Tax=Candida tenuis (strain ATCC 10573 / BCRC 21748 / CBS 615 / JCM 9827 / NBRC 10315 / NRRL Y-1498 / VKM Y-70) TaxID=590646 RepID=G3B4S0_CANTC|nr:ClpP/crotonase [Yamadazyma tenuis ATCC 10573]XP_006686578.1 uncharacterized protein CANTEDRAFT_113882 [Yamadazyma tenuis ATCC 10573]EGV64263.1 ClpP/crotonase [Yamadazyma tenuis ATCC 10573]EGV64264.1 hypothetical protein CANTEDRAFT_113882 [Yamadazyma tenuis ATCC 10573]WEJ96531.1 hypothetical protein PSN45_004070 [Yamadazyma tenuis]
MPFSSENYQHPEFIVKEIEEGFINLQFNNPKTLNAFAESTWRGYQELLEKLDKDPDTNIILISSSIEKSFSSGLNLKDAAILTQLAEDDSLSYRQKYDTLYKHIIEFQEAISTPARIRTPTICLLNGISYGLAMDIAATCSIRVAVEGVKMSIREIKIGIVADMGSLQRLPFLVNNKSKLNQYALTGEIFGAQEAYDIGLVSKVCADLKSGYEYCHELGSDINQNAQWAIKGTKDSLQFINNGGNVSTGLLDIADYNAIHITKIPSKF